MLDLVVKLIDSFIKGVEALAQRRDRKMKKEFGRDLVECYLRLLEIVNTGDAILRDLRYFVRRYAEHVERQDSWKYDPGELLQLLGRQSINLDRLGLLLGSLEHELRLLVPETAATLPRLFTFKSHTLTGVSRLFANGCIPLRVELGPLSDDSVRLLQLQGMNNREWIWKEITDVEQVSHPNEWGPAQMHLLREFLDREPEKLLSELERQATCLRPIILDRFALSEILWSVEEFRRRPG